MNLTPGRVNTNLVRSKLAKTTLAKIENAGIVYFRPASTYLSPTIIAPVLDSPAPKSSVQWLDMISLINQRAPRYLESNTSIMNKYMKCTHRADNVQSRQQNK